MVQQTQETYSPALPIGHELQEYTIEAILGIGGFGITYRAHDNHLHQKVAIKEFFPANLAARNPKTGTVGIKSPEYQTEFAWGKTRYTQEAQTLARFNHPNIVRVNRYFEANSTSYLVMTFEEGKSLEAMLKEDQEWTQERILGLILPLLSGLEEIHHGGYLHRDIKPDNIILRSKDNCPVLIDFGSARSTFASQTMTALVSPGYGPAEQYSSENADQGPWTDIYAMAAVAYHIISGQVPVPAPNRLKKDSLIPAIFVGRGRYKKSFLAAIDNGLSINERKRPQDIATWIQALTTESSEPVKETPEAPQKIHRISDPIFSLNIPSPTSSSPGSIKQKEKLPPETFLQRNDISGKHLWIGAAGLLTAIFISTIATLSTDKGYLRAAHFFYTTALKAKNPDFIYGFVCPSYFKSEMTRADLDNDANMPAWARDIVIESSTKATITTVINEADGIIEKKTWVKTTPNSFWCRDVLIDFNDKKAKLRAEQPKQKINPNPKKR